MAIIPADTTCTGLPGTRHTYNRYWHTSLKEWILTDYTTNCTQGASIVYNGKSSYPTANRVDPTAFRHVSVTGSGSWVNKDTNPTNFTVETRDFSTLVASMIGLSTSKWVVPFSLGNYKLSSWVALSTLSTSQALYYKEPLQSFFDDADNRLLEKLENNNADIGAFIVELGETATYLAPAVKSLLAFGTAIVTGRWSTKLKALNIAKKRWVKRNKQLRKRDLNDPNARARKLQAVTSRWLEWNFAILPLVGDIEKYTALYKDPLDVLKHLTFVATGSVKVNIDDQIDVRNSSSSYMRNACNVTAEGYCRTSVRYNVYDHELIADKALGINSYSAALYEGVPFSWLVDYVVDLGGFIAALSAVDGLTFLSGYRSARISQNYDLNHVYYTSGTRTITILGNWMLEGYDRSLLHDFPQPTLRFVLDDISLRQAANVGALIAGFLNTADAWVSKK